MNKYKIYASYVFYAFSLLSIIGVGFDVILLTDNYIFLEQGVNIYGLIYYYQVLFISFIFWLFSYLLKSNRKLNITYWIVFITVTALVSF